MTLAVSETIILHEKLRLARENLDEAHLVPPLDPTAASRKPKTDSLGSACMSHALHTLASYPELENFTADMGLQAKPIDLNKQVYGTTFGEQALATKRRL